MADENEVKALIARFWEVRQKLTADTSETTFWAIVAREALLWRKMVVGHRYFDTDGREVVPFWLQGGNNV